MCVHWGQSKCGLFLFSFCLRSTVYVLKIYKAKRVYIKCLSFSSTCGPILNLAYIKVLSEFSSTQIHRPTVVVVLVVVVGRKTRERDMNDWQDWGAVWAPAACTHKFGLFRVSPCPAHQVMWSPVNLLQIHHRSLFLFLWSSLPTSPPFVHRIF